jgi:hypothetical protein
MWSVVRRVRVDLRTDVLKALHGFRGSVLLRFFARAAEAIGA